MTATETATVKPLGYWRAATYFCLVVMLVAAAAWASMFEQFSAQIQDLQQKVQKTAQLQYVAVLQDAQGNPGMLATQAAGEAFWQLQRLNSVAEGREDSMQLWRVPANGPALSLGLVQSGIKTPRVAADESAWTDTDRLAISVENKGGAGPSQPPRLPYLFVGPVIRKAY